MRFRLSRSVYERVSPLFKTPSQGGLFWSSDLSFNQGNSVSETEPTLNPYAPATAVENDPPANTGRIHDEFARQLSLPRTAIRWLVVCSLSAIPSFVFGLAVTDGQMAGMIVGILIFVAAYTILDYQTASRAFRQKPALRRTLRIAYGTRIAISILFPLGAYLDVICGILSVGLTQGITGVEFRAADPMGFFGVVFTTLVQGILLNMVLGCYALLVHGIGLAVMALRRRRLGKPPQTR
jgi:hypothetical protein